ncbi:protein kinase [candidate division CSSED10-310 bacterium]|uniref:Protein kinase n=1 Tax=candidate division CSSED10-310 bacterium TaxID=2855610 RepID=A0ABV6YSN0_UNCC1
MKCLECQHTNSDTAYTCSKCGAVLLPEPEESVMITSELTAHTQSQEVVFANRYEVIEELGQGGMGSVFKAFDIKTQEIIALKILRPEIAMDHTAIERFKNELILSRKISHRYICRMYDLGEEENKYFITMEYVSGQNLRSLIKRHEKLSIKKTLFFSKQICEGLAEAHRLGIVHRDLKPHNIMIDQDGDVRIVDFGIARSFQSEGITRTGAIIGTPEYMSPEQLESKKIDHRSDIYSFGAILFEMVTGSPPFRGKSIFTVAFKQKSEKPPSPQDFNIKIPDDLSRIILKCLEKKEEDRYQTIEEVSSDLKMVEQNIDTSESAISEKKTFSSKEITVQFTPKKLVTGVIVLLVLVLSAVLIFRDHGQKPLSDRVLVSPFENRTGDVSLDKIGNIAADWITQGLFQTGMVSLVPVSMIPHSNQVPEGEDRIRYLSEKTGARIIVSGTYYLIDETLQFQAHIIDASESKILSALAPIEGSKSDPLPSIELLRQRLLGALATIYDPRLRSFAVVGCQPPTYKSYQEYIKGLQLFLELEFAAAIPHFERAESLDSSFPQPLIFAAAAYLNQGDFQKAGTFAQKVEVLSDKLSPVDRNIHLWLQALLRGDKEGALRASRSVSELAPGTAFDYQLGLDALRTNRLRESVAQLNKLDPEGSWLAGWYAYWGILTTAYHLLGEHEQELIEAQKARKLYPDIPMVFWSELRALAALGRNEEFNEVFNDCLTLLQNKGLNSGRIMMLLGYELRVHGQKKASRLMFERALTYFESQQHIHSQEEDHRPELANVLYYLQRWQESRTILKALLAEDPENVNTIGYLGMIAARRGERDEALKIVGQLADMQKPYLFGQHTFMCACIHALLNEREKALSTLRTALSQGIDYPELHADLNLETLQDYKPFQDLIRPKE